jgi:signal transduction histidine kinase
MTKAVLRSGQALVVPDLHASPYVDPQAAPSLPRQSELVLPLLAGDQRLGAAIVAFHSPHHFPPEEIQRGEQAAGQIALALARARLFDATRRHADELSIASDLLRRFSVAPQILDQFDALAAGLKQLARCQYALMALRAPDGLTLRLVGIDSARVGAVPLAHIPLASGLVAGEVLAGQTRFVANLADSTEPLDRTLAGWGAKAHVTFPLRAGQNVIGLIALLWTETVEPGLLNLALFSQIMDALALAVEKDRLLDETLRRAAELEAIAGVSEALRAVDSAEAILGILIDRSLTVFGAEAGAVLTPAADQSCLVYAFHRHLPDSVAAEPLPLEGSIAGRVFQTGQAYLSPDVTRDPLADPVASRRLRAADPRRRAALYAPLRSGQDIIGVLVVNSPGPRQFVEADLRLLNTIAEIGGNALQRARVLETLEQRVAERTRELARANVQLQELDRLKDQFVSNVSHELRTPLTAIKLHLGLLDKRGAEALPRYLPVLQRETERLRRLIEDLLDLSRLRARSTPLQRELHRLDTLMAHVLALYSTRAEEREVTLRHLVNDGVPLVPVDHAQLTQVFSNLVANAVTYTVRGGQVTVSSHLESSGVLEGVAVRVHNDGPPIPSQDLPHLFTRFYRGQTARESGEPGTGLGLAICKEIVERHGGFMDVSSGEEQGTTFIIWLPLTAAGLAAG